MLKEILSKIKFHLFVIRKDILMEPLNKGRRFKFFLNYIIWNLFYKYNGKQWIVEFENGLKSIVEPFPDHDAGEVNIYTRNVDFYDILLIRSIINKEDYVIDAGCNIGNRTLAIADVIKGALLIDAGKAAIQRTKKNLSLNNLESDNFITLYKAVSDKMGKVFFSNLGGASTINKVVDENYVGEKEEVIVTTLDELVNNYPFNFSFIKIDVEGQDYKTLLGAKQILKEKKVKLIKFEHNLEDPLEPIVQLFVDNNWKIFGLNKQGNISEDRNLLNINMNLFACPENYFSIISSKYNSTNKN